MARTRFILILAGAVLATLLVGVLGTITYQRYSAYEEIRQLWPVYKLAVEQHHEALVRAGAIPAPAQAPRPQPTAPTQPPAQAPTQPPPPQVVPGK